MGGNTYPVHESLPADIERRRLSAAEKIERRRLSTAESVPRSVKMWPVAADIIEAEPIVADAVPSELPQRRMLRRGKSVATIRRGGLMSGSAGFSMGMMAFQGNF